MEDSYLVDYTDLDTNKKHRRVYYEWEENKYQKIKEHLSTLHKNFVITSVNYVPPNYTVSYKKV